MPYCLIGAGNHLNNSGAPGGPSPAGDNVNVSNPFDDVSPSSNPRGGPFVGGQHPPYPAGAPPRQQGQNYSGGQGGELPHNPEMNIMITFVSGLPKTVSSIF